MGKVGGARRGEGAGTGIAGIPTWSVLLLGLLILKGGECGSSHHVDPLTLSKDRG